jgi:hypothetical protein
MGVSASTLATRSGAELGRRWAKAERADLLRQHLARQLAQKRLFAGNAWVRPEGNPTDNISRQRGWPGEGAGKLRHGMCAVGAGWRNFQPATQHIAKHNSGLRASQRGWSCWLRAPRLWFAGKGSVP